MPTLRTKLKQLKNPVIVELVATETSPGWMTDEYTESEDPKKLLAESSDRVLDKPVVKSYIDYDIGDGVRVIKVLAPDIIDENEKEIVRQYGEMADFIEKLKQEGRSIR